MTRTGRQEPTQARTLPYDRTRGDKAAKLYSLTGRELLPWQKALLRDIMAVSAEGLWTHTRFGYAVPRRNGKTEDVYARELYGLVMGERILHTAHRATTAHASWEALFELLKKAGVPIRHTYRASGREHIFVAGGGRIEYRTRTSKGGLGEGYDLLVVDEAQEYADDHETALKYIVTASRNPQTILLGTPPTAVSSGTVFPRYRAGCLAGSLPDAGWAEWSVEKQTDPQDREAWYETNPSLGLLLTERNIEAEITEDPVDFNIQRLGLWVSYEQKSEIPVPVWAALEDRSAKVTGPLFCGVKYAKDGGAAAVAVAAKTGDGRVFVECVGSRPTRDGNHWILQFLQAAQPQKVVIDGASGQRILADEMQGAGIRKKPMLPTVAEIIEANARFLQAVELKTLCHAGQETLAASVTNAEKRPIGSNGGFGFRSMAGDIDIAPMDACILAHWACAAEKEKKPQRVSY